jgi:hypothetical protein
MRISFYIAIGGVGLLIIEFSGTGGGGRFLWLGLLLIGLGGIWALFELLADTIKGTFRSHDPKTRKARSRWGTWAALLIFGPVAVFIWWFLNWLPGPI